jgi:hypothetical protein
MRRRLLLLLLLLLPHCKEGRLHWCDLILLWRKSTAPQPPNTCSHSYDLKLSLMRPTQIHVIGVCQARHRIVRNQVLQLMGARRGAPHLRTSSVAEIARGIEIIEMLLPM